MPLKTIGRPADAEGLEFILDPSLVLYLPLHQLDGSSFASKDAYGHLCSVTGALWTPRGRWFDGGGAADDLINCGSADSIDNIFDGGGSVEVWVNPASDGEGSVARIFSKGQWYIRIKSEVAGFVVIDFVHNWSAGATVGQWVTTTAILPINTWTHFLMTYNSSSAANDPIFYLNGASTAITEVLLPAGTRNSDAAESLIVGNTSVGTATWDGYIGEVRAYKGRILTAPEALRHYELTKWG